MFPPSAAHLVTIEYVSPATLSASVLSVTVWPQWTSSAGFGVDANDRPAGEPALSPERLSQSESTSKDGDSARHDAGFQSIPYRGR